MIVIGLTGPTGAGKGVVSDLFAKFDIPVLNADEIYRKILIPPSACLNELTNCFGRQILSQDGTLDRKVLASIVFGDSVALEKLNRIAHHYVMAEIRRQIKIFRELEFPAVIMDAPQLFEAGAEKDCNVVVSVLADEQIRVERIQQRDHITTEEALERMRSQHSDEFFRSHSDYTIENNGNPESLLISVKEILTDIGVLPPTV